MGVSGSGKSTLGVALATRLGWPFLDADDFHPPENLQHMASGLPLTDTMREPWLNNLESTLQGHALEGRHCVLAFSGLRYAHRERLRALQFRHFLIHLTAPPDVIARRLASRQGHFMPASLLASQQRDLEVPGNGEDVYTLDVTAQPEQLAISVVDAVSCFLLHAQ